MVEWRQRHVRFLEQCNYSVRYCNGGYMSLHTIKPTEGTLCNHVNQAWVIMCQCRFMDFNKYTTLIQATIVGRLCTCQERGIREVCTLFNLSVNLKLLWKKSIFKKWIKLNLKGTRDLTKPNLLIIPTCFISFLRLKVITEKNKNEYLTSHETVTESKCC